LTNNHVELENWRARRRHGGERMLFQGRPITPANDHRGGTRRSTFRTLWSRRKNVSGPASRSKARQTSDGPCGSGRSGRGDSALAGGASGRHRDPSGTSSRCACKPAGLRGWRPEQTGLRTTPAAAGGLPAGAWAEKSRTRAPGDTPGNAQRGRTKRRWATTRWLNAIPDRRFDQPGKNLSALNRIGSYGRRFRLEVGRYDGRGSGSGSVSRGGRTAASRVLPLLGPTTSTRGQSCSEDGSRRPGQEFRSRRPRRAAVVHKFELQRLHRGERRPAGDRQLNDPPGVRRSTVDSGYSEYTPRSLGTSPPFALNRSGTAPPQHVNLPGWLWAGGGCDRGFSAPVVERGKTSSSQEVEV